MKRALTALVLVGCGATDPTSPALSAPAASRAAPEMGPAANAVTPSVGPRRAVDNAPLARPEPFAGIPVLLFHQICPDACTATDTYGVSRAEFDRMLEGFADAGYESISMAAAARAHRGDLAGLPRKPLLITFDDSREDAYVGADDVLAIHGFRATMFVITHVVESSSFFMTWSQVRAAASSGRWDIQLHADAGHVLVPVRAVSNSDAGLPAKAPFFANVECVDVACSTLETFEDWRTRTSHDLANGEALLTAQLGDGLYESLSFAVPYGDYGQKSSNDPRIAPALAEQLDAQYELWFTQPSSNPPFMLPSATSHQVPRYTVERGTTAERVVAWLRTHERP